MALECVVLYGLRSLFAAYSLEELSVFAALQEVTEPACEEAAALLWQRLGKNKRKRAEEKKKREKENRVSAKQGVLNDTGNLKRKAQPAKAGAALKKNPGPALENQRGALATEAMIKREIAGSSMQSGPVTAHAAGPKSAGGYDMLAETCTTSSSSDLPTTDVAKPSAKAATKASTAEPTADSAAKPAREAWGHSKAKTNTAVARADKAAEAAMRPRAGSRGKTQAGRDASGQPGHGAHGARKDVAAHWPFVDDDGTMTDILGYTRTGSGFSSDRVIPRNDYEPPPADSRAIVAANAADVRAPANSNGMAQTVPGAYGGGGGGGAGGARYGFDIGGGVDEEPTDPFVLFGQLTPREQMRRVERTFRNFQNHRRLMSRFELVDALADLGLPMAFEDLSELLPPAVCPLPRGPFGLDWDNHDARAVAWLGEQQWHRIVDTVIVARELSPLPPIPPTASSIGTAAPDNETLPGGGAVRSASAPSRRSQGRSQREAKRATSSDRQRNRIREITSLGGDEPLSRARAPARGQPVGAGQYESQFDPTDRKSVV